MKKTPSIALVALLVIVAGFLIEIVVRRSAHGPARNMSDSAATTSAIDSARTSTTSTTLCDDIATQIRGNPEIGSGGDPLALLSQGEHPYIELGSSSDRLVGGDEVIKRIRETLNPSDELVRALGGFFENVGDVSSLPDSDLHMVETFGGSAGCEDFLFFRSIKGSQSQLLPKLPRKGVSDGENLTCGGYGDNGHLARIRETDAFVETISNSTNNNHEFRVVAVEGMQWGPACRVEADFRTGYHVANVFIPNNGPVTEASLSDVAPQIAEQHDAAKDDPQSFSFGPAVPDDEKENVRTMIKLAAQSVQSQPTGVVVPAFGREKELGPMQGTLPSLPPGDSYPLVLEGRTYLMTVSHTGVGWRISSDSAVILYLLNDGKLEPVGTAIVAQGPGALEFVRASAWDSR
jgi:hypothetical protein